jgi:hypothetical protein
MRDMDVAEQVHQADTSIVSVWTDGGYFEVDKVPGWEPYEREKERKPRSKISQFTKAAQLRQMIMLAKISRKAPLPSFLTLTYPHEYPPDWQDWKTHLHKFVEKAKAAFPTLAALWKLEPQKRGAPHFHALCWNIRYIPWQWVSVYWAYIIHGIDTRRKGAPLDFPMGFGRKGARQFANWLEAADLPDEVKDSIRAGTDVEKIKTWNGVMHYAAKYILKPVDMTFEGVGRFWGMIGRKHVPWSACSQQGIDVRVAVWIKRIARRFLASKGIKLRSRGRKLRILSNNLLQWVRVCELACDLATKRPILVAVPMRT